MYVSHHTYMKIQNTVVNWLSEQFVYPTCTCKNFKRNKSHLKKKTYLTYTDCENNRCTISYLFRHFFECHHQGAVSVKVASLELVRNVMHSLTDRITH